MADVLSRTGTARFVPHQCVVRLVARLDALLAVQLMNENTAVADGATE